MERIIDPIDAAKSLHRTIAKDITTAEKDFGHNDEAFIRGYKMGLKLAKCYTETWFNEVIESEVEHA